MSNRARQKLTWLAAVIAWRQVMIIGLPEKIKTQENRVALPPSGASQPARRGHDVVVMNGKVTHPVAAEGRGIALN